MVRSGGASNPQRGERGNGKPGEGGDGKESIPHMHLETVSAPPSIPVPPPGSTLVPGCPHAPPSAAPPHLGVLCDSPQSGDVPSVLSPPPQHPGPWVCPPSSAPAPGYPSCTPPHSTLAPGCPLCPPPAVAQPLSIPHALPSSILAPGCPHVPLDSTLVPRQTLCVPQAASRSAGAGGLTLKVLPTDEAGVDVDVGQRDGAELLKIKIQDAPGTGVELQGGPTGTGGRPGLGG